ncbi:hypothetical protein D187_005072 [Cystobacter fuscus DSM 2262]|uniref:Uncharacterized protein n=1 Tax=Cystobacter fuscus (strain ATCC 25194 / DSM 2262 / NBRC 100088 / M29) TaxID=1242864 RepID=S9QRM6_CYSF2|nr:hypothetical protein D187_005072 [Cystobacter fuscus DSM 2262]
MGRALLVAVFLTPARRRNGSGPLTAQPRARARVTSFHTPK